MRMKFTFKSLLLAAGLLMGSVNAWAETKTLYPIGDADPNKSSNWTVISDIGVTEVEDYIKLAITSGSGSRSVYINFYDTGADFYNNYESYTVTFDVYSVNGWSANSSETGVTVYTEGARFPDGGNTFASKNYTTNNYLFDLHNAAAYATTFKVNGGEEANLTMATGKWYNIKLDVTIATGDVVYSVTDLSDNTVVSNGNGTYNATADGTPNAKCQGIFFQLGRGCSQGVYVRNIKVTTEVDGEVVDNPVISITGVKGAERTVTIKGGESTGGNTVTTYYTTDGSEPTAESGKEYSAPFTVSESCTVKAICISETGAKSDIVELYVAVGEITLNAPTFAKTAYSNGSYTVVISSNQSDLIVVPSSSTIYYSIDDAAVSAYSTALQVAEGSTVTAYVASDGYTQSETVTCETSVRPNYYATVWTEDYTEVTNDGTTGTGTPEIVLSGEVAFTVGGVNFYNMVGYDKKTCDLNTNVGLTNNKFKFRYNGDNSGILQNDNDNGLLGIQNLNVGDVIVIVASGNFLTAANGLQLNAGMCTNTEYYYTATATEASLSVAKGTYNYIKTITVLSPSVSVEISPAGYSTFSADCAVTIPEDLTAYIATATEVNDEHVGTITLEKVEGTVAAKTGLLLKGKANQEYSLPVVAEEGKSYENNLLKPTAADGKVAKDNYIFAYNNEDATKCGFYYLENEVEVGAGKAYLEPKATTEGARILNFVFDDGTATAIETVEAENEADGTLYNVAGQQVGSDYKGIVIKNGKKYLNK